MENSINYRFSLEHDNLVAQTYWSGDLTHEIIADGLVRQNQWILENSNRLPLILVSDYTAARLDNVSENDLLNIADQFHGAEDLFPEMTWIAVMPEKITYDTVRLWQEYAEINFDNAHVVRNRSVAQKIIAEVLERYST